MKIPLGRLTDAPFLHGAGFNKHFLSLLVFL